MIGRIRGKLIENQPPVLVVDVQGVGYELEVPLSAWQDLPSAGQPVDLFTHLVVREDAQLLFGFLAKGERDLFRLLIKVNGIGPKVALAILSHMSAAELAACIQDNSITRLTKIPGIGKKTAERLCLDLRDKLTAVSTGESGQGQIRMPSETTDPRQEAEEALLALGYKPAEAQKAVKLVYRDDMSREALIREVLKRMV